MYKFVSLVASAFLALSPVAAIAKESTKITTLSISMWVCQYDEYLNRAHELYNVDQDGAHMFLESLKTKGMCSREEVYVDESVLFNCEVSGYFCTAFKVYASGKEKYGILFPSLLSS